MLNVGIFYLSVALAMLVTSSPPAFAQQPHTVTSIPPGIFSLEPQIFQSTVQAYDDADDYVPYGHDEHDRFSWELYRQVMRSESGNAMISPFSVKLVLAVLYEAAGDNSRSKQELANTLSNVREVDNLRSFYKKILTSLKKENPNYTLNLGTKIYTDTCIEPDPSYAAILSNYYDASVESLSFAHAREAVAQMNAWCANVTHDRLKQLVAEENLQHDLMVLANVIYFKGLWQQVFPRSYEGAFFRARRQMSRVRYMEQTEDFFYYRCNETNMQLLRLPYKGKKFSMFLLLPSDISDLSALVQNLQNDRVKRMQWMMEKTKVRVTVPRFKFEFRKDLKGTLQTLGINEVFSNNAALPGLLKKGKGARAVKVSDIFQKSGIEVNEKGTEAYAATVLEIVNKFGHFDETEEFNANRPFLFFIEEEHTGNIMFAGKVIDPST